jgi:hypothetical protein
MKHKYIISSLIVILNFTVSLAQLDNIHYLPPLKQAINSSGNSAAISQQMFYLSTPESTQFDVEIYLGSSTTPLTTITNLSNGAPQTYNPGNLNNNISLVTNENTGIILSSSGLRFESVNGQKFYVNYRGRNSSQAGSLTSKGQSALGTDFRWGGIPNSATSNGNLSNSMGIMASEDNTLVVISGYDTDCEFRLGNDADGITDDTLTRILNKGETFVLEAIPDETSANNAGWIGTSITSDKPIAISVGGLNVGVSSAASRDVGIDQIVPTNLLGKEYALIRGRGEERVEFAIVVSHLDNTEVYAGGVLVGTIDDGEYLEIPSTYYSSTEAASNMYINTSKESYVYQCMAGQEHIKTLGMNFVAPINCLLPTSISEIPLIDEIAGVTSGESAITIIASTATPNSEITITDGSGNVPITAGQNIPGTTEWKTFGITGLVGEVSVTSTGPIAVGVFMGYGNNAGLAGYFSGFDTAPDVEIQLTNSHCIPGILLSETSTTYDAYQWYYEDVILSGETSSTITPTQDGDYFLEVTSGSCTFTSNNIDLIACPTSIDFDGVDDYVQTSSVIDDVSGVSGMAWVNLKNTFSAKGYVLGEDDFKLYVNNDLTLVASVTTDQGIFSVTTTNTITTGEWVHLAIIYDGVSLKIYINGSEESSISSILGTLELNSTDFFIGKNPAGNLDYLEGYVQEVKVFGKALTATQLQEQVYQTIVSNNGNVMGEITSHDIENLLWSDLKLYLKLTFVEDGFTPDASDNNETNALYNIETIQETTAPLPYVANASGAWSTEGTWEHGDVWDIENLPNKDWSIVQLTNGASLTSANSHVNLGLIIDSGCSLTINNDQLLQNTRYLRIDGEIDLNGESQLIQTETSVLDASSSGYLERNRPGMGNLYRYNFRSSPVSLINNTDNNLEFSVRDILTGANEETITYVGGYDGSVTESNINIAEYWIFRFRNLNNDYDSWEQIKADGLLKSGEGFTLKGTEITGTSEYTQDYTFKGKPNNGEIRLPLSSGHAYLVGNPYPSALEADEFILDNVNIRGGSTTGTIYYWEHYGGESHYLSDYQAGFATYNLAGTSQAATPNLDVDQGGSQQLGVPKKYIPVGQGFFMISAGFGEGEIVFKNSQRTFEKESSGESQFYRIGNTETTANDTTDDFKRVHFYFSQKGGVFKDLLLAVKEGLSLGVEYGYDAPTSGVTPSDCNWKLNDTDFVIQSIGGITDDLVLPLNIVSNNTSIYSFEMGDLTDFDESIEVFLKDELLGVTTQLFENIPIELALEKGTYKDRFSIVFKEEQVLSAEEIIDNNELELLEIYFDNSFDEIVLNKENNISIIDLNLYDIQGKRILNKNNGFDNLNEIRIPVKLANGVYVIAINSNGNKTIKKKLIVY